MKFLEQLAWYASLSTKYIQYIYITLIDTSVWSCMSALGGYGKRALCG